MNINFPKKTHKPETTNIIFPPPPPPLLYIDDDNFMRSGRNRGIMWTMRGSYKRKTTNLDSGSETYVTLHFLRFGEIPCDTFITSFPDPRADPAQLSRLQKNELNKLPRNLKFRSLERESIKVCFVLCDFIPSCLGVAVASGLYGGMNLLLCCFLISSLFLFTFLSAKNC